MIVEVIIPTPGESISEVEVAQWMVKSGDYVTVDQEIAEIESDKATLPLLATHAGSIELLVEEGDTVEVGSIACKINTNAEAPAAAPEAPKAEKPSNTEKPEPIPQTKASENADLPDGVKVTPVAKAMMAEHGLSVDDVLNGLRHISSREVEAVVAHNANSGGVGNGKSSAIPESFERSEDRAKMSQLRKKLSKRLVQVKNETAMLTTFNEVDMTNVKAMRARFQESFIEKYGIKLGFMSFFTKAVAKAMEAHPLVNAWIDGEEIVTPNFVDVGIAVSTPKGLMVPIVRDTQIKGLGQIESDIAELASKARKGRLSLDDMTGGTFTITNGGVFGSMMSTPIINPPQSGILGMHNIIERPVAINGKVEIRPMMYTALSYDHRVIDGKDSVGFLVKLKEYIENPELMLIDL